MSPQWRIQDFIKGVKFYPPLPPLTNRRRSSVNCRGKTFLPEIFAWKINKMPELYMIGLFARQINKILEFYMIMSEKINKMSEFYMIFLRNFFPEFGWGGKCPGPCPWLLRLPPHSPFRFYPSPSPISLLSHFPSFSPPFPEGLGHISSKRGPGVIIPGNMLKFSMQFCAFWCVLWMNPHLNISARDMISCPPPTYATVTL